MSALPALQPGEEDDGQSTLRGAQARRSAAAGTATAALAAALPPAAPRASPGAQRPSAMAVDPGALTRMALREWLQEEYEKTGLMRRLSPLDLMVWLGSTFPVSRSLDGLSCAVQLFQTC